MWLFTTQGFYSVVAHREDLSTDYRHRAHFSRAEWLAGIAELDQAS